MIKNEWDQADSDNKEIIKTCPMVIKCLEGFPICQTCINNGWADFLSKHPTPASAFDFDRPDGHAEARRKAGWLR